MALDGDLAKKAKEIGTLLSNVFDEMHCFDSASGAEKGSR
jgi:hypothetical protein